MFEEIRGRFGTLDVMVSNARVELATGFYQSPLEIPLDKFELTFDSQVRAFHVLTRHMVELLPTSGGRVIAVSYSPSAERAVGSLGRQWGRPRLPWTPLLGTMPWHWRSAELLSTL